MTITYSPRQQIQQTLSLLLTIITLPRHLAPIEPEKFPAILPPQPTKNLQHALDTNLRLHRCALPDALADNRVPIEHPTLSDSRSKIRSNFVVEKLKDSMKEVLALKVRNVKFRSRDNLLQATQLSAHLKHPWRSRRCQI